MLAVVQSLESEDRGSPSLVYSVEFRPNKATNKTLSPKKDMGLERHLGG